MISSVSQLVIIPASQLVLRGFRTIKMINSILLFVIFFLELIYLIRKYGIGSYV